MTMSSNDRLREARASLNEPPRRPVRKLAVVTCMDARLDPWRILRAVPGDIHVIRNAGGIVTEDVVRSLVVSQVLLGTDKVMVIMHTDCGMEGADETSIAAGLREATGSNLGGALGSFEHVGDELQRGMQVLRDSPLVQGTISGAIYDVRTGALRTVVD
jgi:carbonic anhydrase